MPPRSIKTQGRTLAPGRPLRAQGDAAGASIRTPRSTPPVAALDAAVLDDDPGQDAAAGHPLRAQVFPAVRCAELRAEVDAAGICAGCRRAR